MKIQFTLLLGFTFLICTSALSADDKKNDDSSEWINLFPGPKLEGWKRTPIAPKTTLSKKNPWKVDVKRKVLICDGVDVMEMLLYEKPFTDGTYHVEWRFRKVKGSQIGYNGGVYVRTPKDGKQWVQAQVAHVGKAPNTADLFGDVLINGKRERMVFPGKGSKLANPPGEWNTYDITLKGKSIVVHVNGKEASKWEDCPLLKGHVGLQAELYYLEFRNLRFRPAK